MTKTLHHAVIAASILAFGTLPCMAQTTSGQMSSSQMTSAGPIVEDARTHLKPGYLDAGVAALNMELVASLPRPEGFFNPQDPRGAPMVERQPGEGGAGRRPPAAGAGGSPPAAAAPAAGAPPANANRASATAFSNSDIGLDNGKLVVGSFHGFNIYDVTQEKPRLVASVACPGGQGDVSIYGHLVFMSVEATNGRIDCGAAGNSRSPVNKDRFRGVRIFDISDVAHPRQIAAVQTCRGSHTHTLVPDRHDPRVLYVYNQGTSSVRSGEELAGCSNKEPEVDPHTSLYSIDVIKVPLDAPEKAAIIDSPRIFASTTTGAINGLWHKAEGAGPNGAGNPGNPGTTNHCHDITVYTDLDLAAAACSGNGLLLSIADPAHPQRLDAVSDPNFAYWHAAIFSNDGKKVVFTDEWGGGTAARCRITDKANWGGDIVFDIVDHKLVPRAYYKISSAIPEQSNCVAHNGGLVPIPGRDILVQGWYSGGISVMDFTNSAHPKEIAYYANGPMDAKDHYLAGNWTATWYQGRIYAPEIARGLEVLKLKPSAFLTKNEIAAADLSATHEANAQSQHKAAWPDKPVVARAYLDQLVRGNAISADRAKAVTKALDVLDKHRAKAGAFASLAADLNKDAENAKGRDSERFKDIARILTTET